MTSMKAASSSSCVNGVMCTVNTSYNYKHSFDRVLMSSEWEKGSGNGISNSVIAMLILKLKLKLCVSLFLILVMFSCF